MRSEHCALAVFNTSGRCIAACHYTIETCYEEDCTGQTREGEQDMLEAGRECTIAGGKRLNGT